MESEDRIPSYTGRMANSLGNALHRLRSYVHPHVTQTMEQSEVAVAGNSEQVTHIYRQAVKIQRGDRVDCITAFIPKA
jgi:hypothetical protein